VALVLVAAGVGGFKIWSDRATQELNVAIPPASTNPASASAAPSAPPSATTTPEPASVTAARPADTLAEVRPAPQPQPQQPARPTAEPRPQTSQPRVTPTPQRPPADAPRPGAVTLPVPSPSAAVSPPQTTEAPPAPTATTPTAPAIPPSSPVESDDSLIRGVLRTYERAYETKSVDLFRSVRPGLSAAEESRLRTSFSQVDSQQVDIAVEEIRIEGRAATVRLSRRDTITSGGRRQTAASRQTLRLEKTAGAWIITEIIGR